MKEIVNLVLRGDFYCNSKEIIFHGNPGVNKKLAALIGSRIVRDGELQIVLKEKEEEVK